VLLRVKMLVRVKLYDAETAERREASLYQTASRDTSSLSRKTNPTAKNTSYTIARSCVRNFCMYARIEKATMRTASTIVGQRAHCHILFYATKTAKYMATLT